MAHDIRIPRLGWSMDEGTFIRWLKPDGATVREGEPLFELESDKAVQEIEAIASGVLRVSPHAPQPGAIAAVGTLLGYLAAEEEAVSFEAAAARQPATTSQPPSPPEEAKGTSGTAPARTATRSVASPRARRLAAQLGVDWMQLPGSGRTGRVRAIDVRKAGENLPLTGGRGRDAGHETIDSSHVPLTPRRRAIAQRMLTSLRNTAPVTLTTRADATNLVNLRAQLQAAGGPPVIPSYTDIVVKLVAGVLRQHLSLAGRWAADRIILPQGIHIGIAVDTDDGLLVPVIHDVPALSLTQLAQRSQEIVSRARSRRLTANDVEGGVFTVSNLGALGIDAFTPIINYPETAVLGVGAIRREPVVGDEGTIVARHQVTLSLTFDHRVVDGAPAARFLHALCVAIENPSAWLLRDA